MYTSMLLLALAGSPVMPAADEGVQWQSDYSAARKLAQEEKKPMAVFVASGKNGWQSLVKEGSLGKDSDQALNANYIPVYLDTETPAGKRMAAALELTGPGLVISDRGASLMAYHHEGKVGDRELAGFLKQYADPERVAKATDSNVVSYRSNYPQNGAAGTTISNYPPTTTSYYPPATTSYYPSTVAPSFGGGGCPGGRCH